MQTYNSYYERELAKLIDERINHVVEIISNGALSDFSQYQKYVGIIEGIKSVRDELMPEADKICQEKR